MIEIQIASGAEWNAFVASPSKFLCELCFKDMIEVGSIAPNVWVGKKINGDVVQYFLVGGQGHKDDILWSGTEGLTPSMDPLEILAEDEVNNDPAAAQTCDAWLDQATDEMYYQEIDEATNTKRVKSSKLELSDVRGAWFFVEDLKEGGYEPTEGASVEYWLYHQMGKVIAEYNAAQVESPS